MIYYPVCDGCERGYGGYCPIHGPLFLAHNYNIRKRVHHYLEGSNYSVSNWLQYVNCAECEEYQNLIAFQYKKNMYYRTYKEVEPYMELPACYGDKYAINSKKRTVKLQPRGSFKCDVCHELFASQEFMVRHRKSHPHMVPDKKYKCPICPYSTNFSGNLRSHLSTHSGEKVHQCPLCGKKLSRKYHLHSHILNHTGEKPFECIDCGKKFRIKGNLDRHRRIHAKVRPYICPTCEKAFVNASNLNIHKFVHTRQKPFKCQQCDYKSVYSGSLRKHVEAKHLKKQMEAGAAGSHKK